MFVYLLLWPCVANCITAVVWYCNKIQTRIYLGRRSWRSCRILEVKRVLGVVVQWQVCSSTFFCSFIHCKKCFSTYFIIVMQLPQTYSRSCKKSKRERFAKIIHDSKSLIIFAKRFLLDVWKVSKYTSVVNICRTSCETVT